MFGVVVPQSCIEEPGQAIPLILIAFIFAQLAVEWRAGEPRAAVEGASLIQSSRSLIVLEHAFSRREFCLSFGFDAALCFAILHLVASIMEGKGASIQEAAL